MVYLIGVTGFIGGFIFGQMVLYFLLRHKSQQDLLSDKYLKLKYGLVNWAIAGLGAYGFVAMYNQYLG